jgi:5'(3')-deoxyribonucleotidase
MKQRIGIDVDGVIRDFSTGLYKVIKEHYPDYIKPGSENVYSVEEIRKEMTNWDLENSFNAPKEEIQRIYREEYAETILANGAPFKENVDYLREQIRKDEHTFIAVTSQHPICSHHTLTWLGNQGLGFQSVYFRKGRKKWQVEIDYLIDDSPNNYGYWKDGRQDEDGFILMDRPWNQKVNPKHRVFNLKEVERIIL